METACEVELQVWGMSQALEHAICKTRVSHVA